MNFLTLFQLNSLVEKAIKTSLPSAYWVVAETSDVRIINRHCYLELIERNEDNNSIIAKAGANIWASTFETLRPYFEEKTGQSFVSGIKILVKVTVSFHPLYGYRLYIWEINPTYTLGDIKAKREEILRQLEKEGILRLNKELELSLLPQRIAVISSASAAGYEDFCNHLENNPYGFVFYPYLFPATMQGEQTEASIIAALDKIFCYKDLFDAVVIIRGGGATSDLTSFDSYALAANCAQFPLPIITGIGHERDDTVLDFISFHRAKTPTAVADYLINCVCEFSALLDEKKNAIVSGAEELLSVSREKLRRIKSYLPLQANQLIEKNKSTLHIMQLNLKNEIQRYITTKKTGLEGKKEFFKLSSPDYILEKGYSITLKNGKSIKSSDNLKSGDEIETIFHKGKTKSVVS